MSKPTVENKRVLTIIERSNNDNMSILNGLKFKQKVFESSENHYIIIDELDNVLIYQKGKLLQSKYLKHSFLAYPLTAIKETMFELLHILIPQQLVNIYIETLE